MTKCLVFNYTYFSFSDHVNKKTLTDIQESIFVLNLDEAMPATRDTAPWQARCYTAGGASSTPATDGSTRHCRYETIIARLFVSYI